MDTTKYIDLSSDTTKAFSYWDLFTKPKAPPARAEMSYEQSMMALYKAGAISRDFWEQPSNRNVLTTVTKHVAKERGCDFSSALDYVLNTAKPMTDADFAEAGKIDPSTKQGRDAIHAAVMADMANTGVPFTQQYAETLTRLVREGKLQ